MPDPDIADDTITVIRVAVPSPLRRLLDYLPPAGISAKACQPGSRCVVTLGKRAVTGIIIGHAEPSCAPSKLKSANELLDDQSLFDPILIRLLNWATDYYAQAPGEVWDSALPAGLRKPVQAELKTTPYWIVTEAARAADLSKAPQQSLITEQLLDHPMGLAQSELKPAGDKARRALQALERRGLARCEKRIAIPAASESTEPTLAANTEQESAIQAIAATLGTFTGHLLDGITGSGKTEVFLRLIEQTIARGEQALVLTPEIGLTPQFEARCHSRLSGRIITLHSGLADGERTQAWLLASAGHADLVIGTRSAIFTPLPRLGLIVVDEEHDASYKQQDGFRYSARDLAVVRAQLANCPLVLGSATPSLESLANVQRKRYIRHQLTQRAGNAVEPDIRLIDIRDKHFDGGLSTQLLKSVQREINAGNQCLLFINRRGYAPVLLCHSCGWNAQCTHCAARLTYHRNRQRLICHHCGHEQRAINRCPDCSSIDLSTQGQGTEQLEWVLRERFADTPVIRIDRDSTKRRGEFDRLLEQANNSGPAILIGTQMLAKGHHLPNITLVGIVDADQGLYSTDFRATERLGQLILQVAGRAGRADKPGKVLVQTNFPDHPLFSCLLRRGYPAFAAELMHERRQAAFPPVTHAALIRAEDANQQAVAALLEEIATLFRNSNDAQGRILGPAPAPLERRAGRFRMQLLLIFEHRQQRQRQIAQLIPAIEKLRSARRIRWSIDIDPQDLS